MIDSAGLLKPEHLARIGFAWEKYLTGSCASNSLKDSHVIKNVNFQFVGLFDTVLGPNQTIYKSYSGSIFHSMSPSKNIRYGLHLIALDDKRSLFEPIFWTRPDASRSRQKIEQILMPGVHSDIGGTYGEAADLTRRRAVSHQNDFIGSCALLTMIDRISENTSLLFSRGFRSSIIESINDKLYVVINKDPRLTEIPSFYRRSVPNSAMNVFHHPLCAILDNSYLKYKDDGLLKYNAKYVVDFSKFPQSHSSLMDYAETTLRKIKRADRAIRGGLARKS
jgi:hypothetical protein